MEVHLALQAAVRAILTSGGYVLPAYCKGCRVKKGTILDVCVESIAVNSDESTQGDTHETKLHLCTRLSPTRCQPFGVTINSAPCCLFTQAQQPRIPRLDQ